MALKEYKIMAAPHLTVKTLHSKDTKSRSKSR